MKYIKVFFIFILSCTFFVFFSFYVLPMILFLLMSKVTVAQSYRFIYYIGMTVIFATIVTCTYLIISKIKSIE
ncbi:hypothetical protein GCM10008907_35390 [Clostridium sartagoforme]|jgi:hypothetical protein